MKIPARLPFAITAVITLSLMCATAIEKLYGTSEALRMVYDAPWITALWALAALSTIWVLAELRRSVSIPSAMLHASLLLILAGAATTRFFGTSGTMQLSREKQSATFVSDDGDSLSLPFAMRLDSCGIIYHPSTRSPRDFFAEIEAGGSGTVRISLNSPVRVDGYRFCLNSLGTDAVTLSVSHDPWGTSVTFTAYGLLFLSLILNLAAPRSAFRLTLRRLTTAGAMLAGVCMSASATPEPVQPGLADTFGRLYVYSDGRVMPVQTFAGEFVTLVHGRKSYEGLSPEQVLAGWIFDYDDWKNEPFIRLKSREAREATGKEYVSLAEVYAGGKYLLEPLLGASRPSADLLADDDRIGYLASVITGKALRIIPRSVEDGSTDWQSWTDNPSGEIPGEVNRLFADFGRGRYRDANRRLIRIREIQRTEGGSLPSDSAVGAERLYNRTYLPLLAAIAAFCSAILTLAGGRPRRYGAGIALTVCAYLTYIIALRWIFSGHVPLATSYETMVALAWIAAAGAAALSLNPRLSALSAPAMAVCGGALIVAMIGTKNPAVGSMMPILASKLLSLHVMLIISAYAMLATVTLTALALLVRPRSERTLLMCRLLLYPALFLLIAGIFVGAIWAERSWGRYWGWDPKETWALITMLVYTPAIHPGICRFANRPRPLAIYLIACFACVLMTYFGVNILLGGLHSYGAS